MASPSGPLVFSVNVELLGGGRMLRMYLSDVESKRLQ